MPDSCRHRRHDRVHRPLERYPRNGQYAVDRGLVRVSSKRGVEPLRSVEPSDNDVLVENPEGGRIEGQLDGSAIPSATNVCSHTFATERNQPARASSDISPASVWLVAPVIWTGTISPGSARPSKFTTLPWRVRPRTRPVGARRALDEHVERPPDEPLRALARAPLDDLDEALHPLAPSPRAGRTSSVIVAASVPRRGEKMNVKAPS